MRLVLKDMHVYYQHVQEKFTPKRIIPSLGNTYFTRISTDNHIHHHAHCSALGEEEIRGRRQLLAPPVGPLSMHGPQTNCPHALPAHPIPRPPNYLQLDTKKDNPPLHPARHLPVALLSTHLLHSNTPRSLVARALAPPLYAIHTRLAPRHIHTRLCIRVHLTLSAALP